LLTATFQDFPIPTANSEPFGITAGPDGNLWFAENNSRQIERITTAGVITEFPAGDAAPAQIASGPDGSLWFTQDNGKGQIGRITPSGTTTFFPVPTQFAGLFAITPGPDGNLWFTESGADQIGRITPGGVVTEFPIPTPSSDPFGIVSGPDGALWFTENNSDQIGRITTAGTITEFAIPTAKAVPSSITAGPDGNLWFNESGANRIGKITPTGTVTEFPVAATLGVFAGITVGADGNLYFGGDDGIGQITPTGTVTAFSNVAQVEGIAKGPDGNIWFTDQTGNEIDELVLSASSGPPAAPDLALSSDAPASDTLGTIVTDTLTVTNDGTAAATGVVLTDTLPPGVTFVSATGGVTPVNGVLTIPIGDLAAGARVQFAVAFTPTAAGALQNQASVGGDEADRTPADNSVTQVTTVTQVTPPVNVDGPIVTSVQRYGTRRQPDGLVVAFNEPLDPTPAQDAANYVLYALGGRRRLLSRKYSHITIRSATLDADGPSVELSFAGGRLNRHGTYELVVKGTPMGGLTGLDGRYLDGRGAGQPGTDYVTVLYGKNLIRSGPGPGRRGTTPPGARYALPSARP
jgi:virginiamycin B lyase